MATAYDTYWKKEAARKYWSEPSEQVVSLVKTLGNSRVRNVLDLGCGIGRHALYLAHLGLNVTALDSSEEALNVLRKTAAEKKLYIKIIQADYCQDILSQNHLI